MLTRGYDDLTVRQLAAHANVGRSTFYEHFTGKDDLLEESVSSLLEVFAATAAARASSDELQNMLAHLDEHRELTGSLLHGATRTILVRVLGDKLEVALAECLRDTARAPVAPLPLLAAALAHTQLGILDAWLSHDGRCDVPTTTRTLQATTRACVTAFFTC